MERSSTALAFQEAPRTTVFSLGESKGTTFLLLLALFFFSFSLHTMCF